MAACVAPELLQGFVAGLLPAADVEVVEEHVDSCADCRAALGEIASASAVTADTQLDHDGKAVRASSSAILPGIQIGRYVVMRKIGEGGMGVVALARDPELRRKVVVKLVKPEHVDPDDTHGIRARLLREAQAMARLAHPNVVTDLRRRDAPTIACSSRWSTSRARTLARWLSARAAQAGRRSSPCSSPPGAGSPRRTRPALVHRDFKPRQRADRRRRRRRGSPTSGSRALRLETRHAARRSDAVLADADQDRRADGHAGVHGARAAARRRRRRAAPISSRSASRCGEALYGSRPFGGETVPQLLEAIHDGAVREPKLVAGKRVHAALLRGLSDDPDKRFPAMPKLLAELVPRSRAVPILATAATVALGAAIAIAALRQGAGAPGPCDGDALADVWTPSARAAITDARAVADLDGYAEGWRAARKQVCVTAKALHIEEDRDRVACLDRIRLELRRVVETAPDRDAVAGLRALDACGDPAPHDAMLGADVAALRMGIEAVEHELGDVKLDDAEARARRVIAASRGLRYAPIEAEALIALGHVQMQRAQWGPASSTMIEAIQVADVGHHDRARGDAQLALVPIFRGLDRADEAERYQRYALASLHDAGSLAKAQLALANTLADSFERQGRSEDAVVQRDHAIELAGTIDNKTLATALADKGRMLRHVQHYAEALPVLERARDVAKPVVGGADIVFDARIGIIESLFHTNRSTEAIAEANAMIAEGNDDGAVRVMLAQIYAERGDAEHAIEHANKQVEMTKVGTSARIEALGVRAVVLFDLKRYADAETDFRDVVAGAEATMGPEDVVTMRNALASSVAKQERFAEAAGLFAQNVTALDASPDPNKPLLANTLVRMADAQLRAGDAAGAIASATRARALIAAGSPHDLGLAAWVLARATLPRDHAKAVAYGKEAKAAYAQTDNKDKLAEIDRWLAQQ